MSSQPSKKMVEEMIAYYDINNGIMMTFEEYLGLLRNTNTVELKTYTTQQERNWIKKMDEEGNLNSQQEKQLKAVYNERIVRAQNEIDKDLAKRAALDVNPKAVPVPDFDYNKLTTKAKKKFDEYVDEMEKNTRDAKAFGGDMKKAFTVGDAAGMSRGGSAKPGTKYNTGNVANEVRKRLLAENTKNFVRAIEDVGRGAKEVLEADITDEKKKEKLKDAAKEVKEIKESIKRDMTDEEKIDFDLEESLTISDLVSEENMSFFNENTSFVDMLYAMILSSGTALTGGGVENAARFLRPVLAFDIPKGDVSAAAGATAGAIGLGVNLATGNLSGAAANLIGMGMPVYNLVQSDAVREAVRRSSPPSNGAIIAAIIVVEGLIQAKLQGFSISPWGIGGDIINWIYGKTGLTLPEATLKLLQMKEGLDPLKAKKTPIYKLMLKIDKDHSYVVDRGITDDDDFTYEALGKIADLMVPNNAGVLEKGEILGDYSDFVDKILSDKELMKDIVRELPKHNPGYIEKALTLVMEIPSNILSAVMTAYYAITSGVSSTTGSAFSGLDNKIEVVSEKAKKIAGEIKEFSEYLQPFQSFSDLPPTLTTTPPPAPLMITPPVSNFTGFPRSDFNVSGLLAPPRLIVPEKLQEYNITKPDPILALPSSSLNDYTPIPENINNNYTDNPTPNIMNFQTAYKTYDDLPEYLKVYMTKEAYDVKIKNTGSINNPIETSQRKAIFQPQTNGLLSTPPVKVLVEKVPVFRERKYLSSFPIAVKNSSTGITLKDSGYQNMIGTATHLNEKGGKKFRSVEYYKEKGLNNEQLLGVETRMLKKVKRNPGF